MIILAIIIVISASAVTAYSNYLQVNDSQIDANNSIINATDSIIYAGENTTVIINSTITPTVEPTTKPTVVPTKSPSQEDTPQQSTQEPTVSPTIAPTEEPTPSPTPYPYRIKITYTNTTEVTTNSTILTFNLEVRWLSGEPLTLDYKKFYVIDNTNGTRINFKGYMGTAVISENAIWHPLPLTVTTYKGCWNYTLAYDGLSEIQWIKQ